MTFQKRLKAAMRRRNMRVADVARWFDRPYTTVREWVLNGRMPDGTERDRRAVKRKLEAMEK
jgi:hypothetical protein